MHYRTKIGRKVKETQGRVCPTFVSKKPPSIFEFAVFSCAEFKAKNLMRKFHGYSTVGCNAIKGTRRYPDPAGNYECLSRYIIPIFPPRCLKAHPPRSRKPIRSKFLYNLNSHVSLVPRFSLFLFSLYFALKVDARREQLQVCWFCR